MTVSSSLLKKKLTLILSGDLRNPTTRKNISFISWKPVKKCIKNTINTSDSTNITFVLDNPLPLKMMKFLTLPIEIKCTESLILLWVIRWTMENSNNSSNMLGCSRLMTPMDLVYSMMKKWWEDWLTKFKLSPWIKNNIEIMKKWKIGWEDTKTLELTWKNSALDSDIESCLAASKALEWPSMLCKVKSTKVSNN